MKTTGSTQRRTPIDTWQPKPTPKNSILQRMRSITQEMGALQEEMHRHLAGPLQGRTGTFFDDAAAIEALNSFKAELDQLRRILWFYVEEAGKKPVSATDQEQQAHRMDRVKGVLRTLAPQNSAPALPGLEPGSFFDRLNVVIDTYMQEKRPVAGERKAAGRKNIKAFS